MNHNLESLKKALAKGHAEKELLALEAELREKLASLDHEYCVDIVKVKLIEEFLGEPQP